MVASVNEENEGIPEASVLEQVWPQYVRGRDTENGL